MKFDPDKHHRRSIRLKGYDYTQEGLYFVTLVVKNRRQLLGKVLNGEMVLSKAGKIAYKNWQKIPQLRANFDLDDFIIMPDHFHGIIIINTSTSNVRATESVAPTARLIPNSLGSVLGQYKSVTTKEIQKSGITQFSWQRNYWERIIRNEGELNRIRRYIVENPLRWMEDRNNSK